MQVMLLAAGRSSRLGALGEKIPKPLVPVCGYPPIAFSLALCRQAGLTDIVVNVHHHAEQIRAAVGDGSAFGVRVRFSQEDELLGTGGGLARARGLFSSEPVLVMNAKVVADLDLRAILSAHAAAPAGTVATMVVRVAPDQKSFAPVLVAPEDRVIALRGEGLPGGTEPPAGARAAMFTGVHVLDGALLDRLPEAGVSDVIAEAYLPALRAGERVGACWAQGYFEEHSTPERYLAGNLALLEKPDSLRTPPGPLVGVDATARVAPDAVLIPPYRIGAGARILAGARVGPHVVLGQGAVVAAGAVVERAVLWPGVTASGTVRDTVITG